MNTPTEEILDRATPARRTQSDQLAEIFAAHPGQWLDMTYLGTQIGAWAVHSRIADLRRTRLWAIENRVTVKPGTGHRISQYRYTPCPDQ